MEPVKDIILKGAGDEKKRMTDKCDDILRTHRR